MQAFRCLTGHVTLACLELILAVLKPKQPVEDVMEEGEDEAKEESDNSEVEEGKEDSSDEGEKEESEDEMEADKEEDSSEEDEEDSADEGDEGSDSSADEGVEEIGGGVDPAFAEAVRQALGAAAAVDSDEEVWSYLNHTPCYISPTRVRCPLMMRPCWQWMRPWGKSSGLGLP